MKQAFLLLLSVGALNPCVAENENLCGPYSLFFALHMSGLRISMEQIRKAGDKGVNAAWSFDDLARAAEQWGGRSIPVECSLSVLRKWQCPAVLSLKAQPAEPGVEEHRRGRGEQGGPGRRTGHFILYLGHAQGTGECFYDPGTGKNDRILSRDTYGTEEAALDVVREVYRGAALVLAFPPFALPSELSSLPEPAEGQPDTARNSEPAPAGDAKSRPRNPSHLPRKDDDGSAPLAPLFLFACGVLTLSGGLIRSWKQRSVGSCMIGPYAMVVERHHAHPIEIAGETLDIKSSAKPIGCRDGGAQCLVGIRTVQSRPDILYQDVKIRPFRFKRKFPIDI